MLTIGFTPFVSQKHSAPPFPLWLNDNMSELSKTVTKIRFEAVSNNFLKLCKFLALILQFLVLET